MPPDARGNAGHRQRLNGLGVVKTEKGGATPRLSSWINLARTDASSTHSDSIASVRSTQRSTDSIEGFLQSRPCYI